MANMTISATDGSGSFGAYLARTQRSNAGSVVVIQEIFGVNQAMRDACDWLASIGFHAICPDLFWRQEPNVDITDKSEAEWKKAFALMNGFNQDKGVEDLKATLAAARTLPGSNGRAGSAGFCLGGRLAFMMAARSDADVNVSYYGVALDNLLGEVGKVTKPLLLHIAEKDEFVPPDAREKILSGVKGKANISAHVYPEVMHAFARVGGVHYDARAATIANGRTAEFLVRALG